MTQLRYNNKSYCVSSSNNAKDITFDNSGTFISTTNLNEALKELDGKINKSWINECDVMEEIEKYVAQNGAASTFFLSFGHTLTNGPLTWEWFSVIYKCSKIFAFAHDGICLNGRNGANNYVGWNTNLSSENISEIGSIVNQLTEKVNTLTSLRNNGAALLYHSGDLHDYTTDLNDINIEPGIYNISGENNISNIPNQNTTFNKSAMLIMYPNYQQMYLEFGDTNQTNPQFMYRSWNFNSQKWNPWHSLSVTII